MSCPCCRPARALTSSPTSCCRLRQAARWTAACAPVFQIRCRAGFGRCIFAATRRGKICSTITDCGSTLHGRVRPFGEQMAWISKPARWSRPVKRHNCLPLRRDRRSPAPGQRDDRLAATECRGIGAIRSFHVQFHSGSLIARTIGARLGNVCALRRLDSVPQMEPTMISVKVLSIAAAMALLLPMVAPTASSAQTPGGKVSATPRGGGGGVPAARMGGGGGFRAGGGAPVARFSGGGGAPAASFSGASGFRAGGGAPVARFSGGGYRGGYGGGGYRGGYGGGY